MYIDKEYVFLVSLSKDAYMNKDQVNAAIAGGEAGRVLRRSIGVSQKICFKMTEVNSTQLLEYVLNGHTFCGLFANFNPNDEKVTYVRQDNYFTLSGKKDEFFQGSYFIGIDIDETNYRTTSDFFRNLTLQPTFWYTSFSNMQVDKETGKSKGLRMRLIYVFNQLISDKYYFRYCSSTLHKQIEKSTNEMINDKCGLKCTQYFNGTYMYNSSINLEYGITNYIYSLSDIDVSNDGYLDYLRTGCEYKHLNEIQKKEIGMRLRPIFLNSNIINNETHTQVISEVEKIGQVKKCAEELTIDPKIIRDLEMMSWDVYFETYRRLYPYVYRVEKEQWLTINNVKYQFCDEDYLELPWIPQIKRDGNHRRSTLFHRGCLRRLIMPDITPTIMFFNLAVDRERFFDNRDGVLSVQLLVSKVKEVFRCPIQNYINEYNDVYTHVKELSKKKKLIIHWTCKKQIKANSLIKELRWQMLDKIYDVNLTLDENHQILNNSDFVICKDSLRFYCKERGIVILTNGEKKYRQFVTLHVDGLSLREEVSYLLDHGLSLNKSTISAYRKRFQRESNQS